MSRVLGAYETLTGIAYMVAALMPAILIASLGVRTVLVLGATVAPSSRSAVGPGLSSSTVTSTSTTNV